MRHALPAEIGTLRGGVSWLLIMARMPMTSLQLHVCRLEVCVQEATIA